MTGDILLRHLAPNIVEFLFAQASSCFSIGAPFLLEPKHP